MAASLTTMANATISPALPGLERLFSDEPNAAMLTRLLVPAPSLGVAICAPLVGLVADRWGRRRLLLAGVLLFVIAGSAGLVLPDLPTIFASRLLLGVAVGLIMTAQTALLGDYFTGDERNALSGLQISARNFGGLIFISLAGWIAMISPRLPFAIYGVAAAVLPLMWRVIVDPPRASRGTETAQVKQSPEYPSWAPVFAFLVLLQALTNMIFFIMPTQLSFFFEAAGYNSAVMTGSALGVLTFTGGCFALLYSRIQRATGYVGIFSLGYGAMALGFMALSLATTAPVSLAAAASVGAGFALVSPSFVTLALRMAPPGRRGLAGGVLTASVFVGQFCSPIVSTPLIGAYGYEGLFRSTTVLLASMALASVLKGCAVWLQASEVRTRAAVTADPAPKAAPRHDLRARGAERI
jgi:MFS family permease